MQFFKTNIVHSRCMQSLIDVPLNEFTILHSCVSANGHVGILRLLLSHDQSRDAVYIRDARGSSALHDAAEQGQVRCLRLLVESTGGKGQLLHQANEVRMRQCVGGALLCLINRMRQCVGGALL